LKGLNWFGFETEKFTLFGLEEQPLETLFEFIGKHGFNALRIPVSLEMVLTNPKCVWWNQADMFKHNPWICYNFTWGVCKSNYTAMEFLDHIIHEAARHGVLVLLDMHRLRSKDVALPPRWYSDEWSEDQLEKGWVHLACRYRDYWNVFGADLKNEPHGSSWGDNTIETDWRLAAERISSVVHKYAPHWL